MMPAIAFAPAAQNEASLETQRHSTLDQPLLPPLPYDSTVAGGSSLTANLNANMAQGVAALLPHRHTGNDAASNGENSADGYKGWFLGGTASGHGNSKRESEQFAAVRAPLQGTRSASFAPLFRGVAPNIGASQVAYSRDVASKMPPSSYTMSEPSFLDAPIFRSNDTASEMTSPHMQPLHQQLQRMRYGHTTGGFVPPQPTGAHAAVSFGDGPSLGVGDNGHLLGVARAGYLSSASPVAYPLCHGNAQSQGYLQMMQESQSRSNRFMPPALLEWPQARLPYSTYNEPMMNGSMGTSLLRHPHDQHGERMQRAHEGTAERVPSLFSAPSAGIASPSQEAYELLLNSFQSRGHVLHLPNLLFCSTDVAKLSPVLVLLRQQVEAFQATEVDVSASVRGRKKPVRVGQVGIRCRHCASLPPMYRGRGSTYFPISVWGFYQAAQNMCALHFQNDSCRVLPPSTQTTFTDLIATKKEQSGSNSGAGRAYWATTAHQMGLVDMKEGVFFICNLPNDVSLPDVTDSPGVYRTPPPKKRKVEHESV